MKRHSLRIRMTITLVAVIALIFCLALTANLTMSRYFYVRSESRNLSGIYSSINRIFRENNLNKELQLNQLTSNNDVNVLIEELSATSIEGVFQYNLIYSNMFKGGYMQKNLISFMQDNKPADFNVKHYYIQTNYDSNMGTAFLDLFGILDNGYYVGLRTPIESIEKSAKVSSQLTMMMGMFGIFIGAIFIYYAVLHVSRPIEEMAVVASKMANLDFDAKVVNLPPNEIGLLGHTMNQLSEKLEGTISELKTANNELMLDNERKTQIDEMRKDFISHVSHELKTPIAIIQGYAEGLKDNVTDDAESKEFYCDVIVDEANRMNKMVRKLLTLSQIEFGNNVVTMERFDIGFMINNLLMASDVLLKEKDIHVEYDSNLSIQVWADEYMIEEVMSNYISNAIHHCFEGGIIRIRFEDRNDTVRIYVFNTGDHIPEEDIDKIWIKFYKVDKARTREYGGSGIGLSIVAATMEAHGKEYGVENVDGGVRFYIDLDKSMK